ncbi:MAG: hypothetical protein U0M15_02725 [Bacillota bacterium]|nr:hypothetical protein [Bacillota bacterium]
MKYNNRLWRLLLLLALTLTLCCACSGNSDSDERKKDEGLAFPYELDDGRLVVQSVMQFSGPNVDNENKEDDNIAGLVLENCSGSYLEQAEITVKLKDGTKLSFAVQDLPTGLATIAFEKKNGLYEADAPVKSITCNPQYKEGDAMDARLTATAENNLITVTNGSPETLSNIKVVYHTLAGDTYMGGTSYSVTIDALAPNETFEHTASECWLGMAQIVGVFVADTEE